MGRPQHAVPYHHDLNTPLLTFNGEPWPIRAAAEATAIFGAPGSGKSSGSARMIAQAMLAAGFGGLVLAAKVGEADTWRAYAKAAGREDDLVVIDASGKERFNILDYTAANFGGRGFERNLVDVMERMAEANSVAGNSGGGGEGEGKFFVDNALKWITHAFPILQLAYGTIRLRDLDRLITSLPQDPSQCDPASPASKGWHAKSFCSKTLILAGERVLRGGDEYARQVIDEHGDFFLDEVAALDNRPRSSIQSTLSNLIYPFLSGKLAELFCTDTTITPDAARDGKIIVMDLPTLKYGKAGAVAQTLFKYLFGLAMQSKPVGEKTRPVMVFADEAQFFVNSADAELLSTSRSSRVCVVYITQDLPTYYARLGKNARDVAESILSKFGTRIFHASLSRETNMAAAELIGKVEKFHINATTGRGRTSGTGGSRNDEDGGFHGQGGANINTSRSTSGYMDYEIPPDYFAKNLRTGSKKHGLKVDGIVISNARLWKHTNRHWIQAEFSQA